MEVARINSKGEKYQAAFWSSDSYKTYVEAYQQGATYVGEICYGYTSFVDAMCNVATAMKCVGITGLRAKICIDDKIAGEDFVIE